MERSDLELVVAVHAHGSLAAAARSLDLAAPVVTKRLAALEARLGQRLFQRTTRRVGPTAEGETLCARAVVLLQGFAALEAELQERKAEPTGLIRLAATFGFGRLWLGPALARFQERYPRIDIQLQLTEQLPDLAAEGFDGAIWLWSVQGRQAAQWVSRRLACNQRVLVATSGYLHQHGAPIRLEDLGNHACLIVRENGNTQNQQFNTWTLHKSGNQLPERVKVQGPLASNSGELVLADYAMPDADIHWLAPYRTDSPRRIRLLIDFLVAQFQESPWKAKPPAASQDAPPSSHPKP